MRSVPNPQSSRPVGRVPSDEAGLRERIARQRAQGEAVAERFSLHLHEGLQAKRELFERYGLPSLLWYEHLSYLGLDPHNVFAEGHRQPRAPVLFGDLDIWVPIFEEELEIQQQGLLLKTLLLASVLESGVYFLTGVPVTFPFIRNTQPAPYYGSRFQQDLEPRGRYMLTDPDTGQDLPRGWERGVVTFKRPLVILFHPRQQEAANVYDGDSWKARLARVFARTGEALSKELAARGYDGIVTVGDAPDTREIVDLTMWKPR